MVTYKYEKVYDEFMEHFHSIGPAKVLKEYDLLCSALELDTVRDFMFVDLLMDLQQIMYQYFVEIVSKDYEGKENA